MPWTAAQQHSSKNSIWQPGWNSVAIWKRWNAFITIRSRWCRTKLVAYAFAEPKVKGDNIRSSGAAFRSKGEWYHLSYSCSTSPDHMTILTFQYAIGQVVPHNEWEHHYLVP